MSRITHRLSCSALLGALCLLCLSCDDGPDCLDQIEAVTELVLSAESIGINPTDACAFTVIELADAAYYDDAADSIDLCLAFADALNCTLDGCSNSAGPDLRYKEALQAQLTCLESR